MSDSSSTTSSNDNSLGDQQPSTSESNNKNASTNVDTSLESLRNLVLTDDWTGVKRILDEPEVTFLKPTAVQLYKAICSFHLNKKSETIQICRKILQDSSLDTSKYSDALCRYYLIASLEDVAEIEAEIKAWQEVAPENLTLVLQNFTMNNLSKIKAAIDTMPADEETKWLRCGTPAKSPENVISCSYCSLNFIDKNELRAHCQTDEHQKVLMSDEGKCSYT